ncbi:glycosyltransferase 87 family protein [Nocardia sp. XZ_19_385]|uniref:glycosyltransferase 87 family protein n=1 Tax=Nocardia sp. XZ_19_385 TaxID=2769488 RepID=UPI0018906812|nr:glycosyltransferase 87 family protein [Nocardia sp. XZ_19_385]
MSDRAVPNSSGQPDVTPVRQGWWLLLAVVAFAASVLVSLRAQWWRGYIDLLVYRNGAQAWLDGNDLYGELPQVLGIHLPFTYPPLAALFFTPLALLPLTAAAVVMIALSVLSLGVTLWLVLVRIRPELPRAAVLALVIGAVAVAQLLEPVRQTLGFGQINLLLMAAVTADCLVRKPFWPRGMLIGIAISIKLVPAAFLLYFLLRRDWQALRNIGISAVAAVGAGFLLFPKDSVQYWFHTVTDTGRIGSPHFAGNQSLKGMLFRLGLDTPVATALWLTLSAVALALAVVWMRRLLDEGATVTALLVNAFALLLVSPVSWSHHWVWTAPALLVAASAIERGNRNPWFLGAVAAFAALLLIGPQWHLPWQRELDWTWWQQLVGSSYVLAALAVLIFAAVQSSAVGVRKAASAAA